LPIEYQLAAKRATERGTIIRYFPDAPITVR